MNNEDQTWENCGQVSLETGLLLTVLSSDGGARRCIQVEAEFMSLLIDLTAEQAHALSEMVIGPSLGDDDDRD